VFRDPEPRFYRHAPRQVRYASPTVVLLYRGKSGVTIALVLAALFAASFVLTNCAARSPPVWVYYDKCNAQTSSFIVMAECGKEARNAECIPRNNCSPEETAFVQFTDALVLSVKNKEMTEAEAMRRYAEYKTAMLSGIRRDQAIEAAGAAVAAGAAAGGSSTCTKIGNTTNCY
jgi:hypothetical protein